MKQATRYLMLCLLMSMLTACGTQPWRDVPVEQRDNSAQSQRHQQIQALREYQAKQQQGIEAPTPEVHEPIAEPSPAYTKPSNNESQVLAPEGLAANSQVNNPAVVRLLKQAKQASVNEQHQMALSFLQRALRISPNNAEVYLAMGEEQQALGQNQQACNLAYKGRQYAIQGSRVYYQLKTLLDGC